MNQIKAITQKHPHPLIHSLFFLTFLMTLFFTNFAFAEVDRVGPPGVRPRPPVVRPPVVHPPKPGPLPTPGGNGNIQLLMNLLEVIHTIGENDFWQASRKLSQIKVGLHVPVGEGRVVLENAIAKTQSLLQDATALPIEKNTVSLDVLADAVGKFIERKDDLPKDNEVQGTLRQAIQYLRLSKQLGIAKASDKALIALSLAKDKLTEVLRHFPNAIKIREALNTTIGAMRIAFQKTQSADAKSFQIERQAELAIEDIQSAVLFTGGGFGAAMGGFEF